jgi:hypothetical protein
METCLELNVCINEIHLTDSITELLVYVDRTPEICLPIDNVESIFSAAVEIN